MFCVNFLMLLAVASSTHHQFAAASVLRETYSTDKEGADIPEEHSISVQQERALVEHPGDAQYFLDIADNKQIDRKQSPQITRHVMKRNADIIPTTKRVEETESEADEGGDNVQVIDPDSSTWTSYINKKHGIFSSSEPQAVYRLLKWVITVTKGRKINIQFVVLDLGYTPPAPCGKLMSQIAIVYSPPSGDIRLYCGIYPPRVVTSKDHAISIHFYPPKDEAGEGILVNYTSFVDNGDSFQSTVALQDTSISLTSSTPTISSTRLIEASPTGPIEVPLTSPTEVPSTRSKDVSTTIYTREVSRTSPFADNSDPFQGHLRLGNTSISPTTSTTTFPSIRAIEVSLTRPTEIPQTRFTNEISLPRLPEVSPTTPKEVSLTTEITQTPSTDEVTPTLSTEVSPTRPKEVSPTRPTGIYQTRSTDEIFPTMPTEISPTTPKEASLTTEITRTTSTFEVTPIVSTEVSPTRPKEVSLTRPTEIYRTRSTDEIIPTMPTEISPPTHIEVSVTRPTEISRTTSTDEVTLTMPTEVSSTRPKEVSLTSPTEISRTRSTDEVSSIRTTQISSKSPIRHIKNPFRSNFGVQESSTNPITVMSFLSTTSIQVSPSRPTEVSPDGTSEVFPNMSTEGSPTTHVTECPVLTGVTGNFSTPDYPKFYQVNRTSCWEIVAHSSMVIRVRFIKFSLDSIGTKPCDTSYSHVTIMDYASDPTVLCGIGNPVVTSSTSRLKVSFESRLGQGPGFFAEFETFIDTCNSSSDIENSLQTGEAYIPALMSRCMWSNGYWPKWYYESGKESEWVASPSFPRRYPPQSHCFWAIRAELGNYINIHFKSFDLGEEVGTFSNCSNANAYVLIRDCVSSQKWEFCGDSRVPEELIIQSSTAEIEFFSRQTNGRGFQAYYTIEYSEPKDSGRKEQIHTTPARYPMTSDSLPVSLVLKSTAVTTATSPPMTAISSTTISLVHDVAEVTTNPICDSVGSDECGGITQSEFGFFSSSNYPEDFPTNENCRWTINSINDSQKIVLKFFDVDLGVPPSNGECDTRYSFIQVNISDNSHILCDTAGSNLFLSNSSSVNVDFSSLYSSGRGFCAVFITVQASFNGSLSDLQFPCVCDNLHTNISWDDAKQSDATTLKTGTCQFLITNGSGFLPAVDFPSPYAPDSECVWTLLAEPGQYIRLEFLHFDLDDSGSKRKRCLLSDTHVQVTLFEGDTVLQKRFCSKENPSRPIPSASAATVKFKSRHSSNNNHTGFLMSYVFVSAKQKEFRFNLMNNFTVSNSSSDEFGFRVFDNSYSQASSLQSEDESFFDSNRKTNTDNRTRIRVPTDEVSPISDIPSESLYNTLVPNEVSTLSNSMTSTTHDTNDFISDEIVTKATGYPDVSMTSSLTLTTGITHSTSISGDRGQESTTSGGKIEVHTHFPVHSHIPDRGRLTARQMELTIYVCTAVAAILIIALITLTLYCANKRNRRSKSGFDVDAADEANYWQTYKDWAKDWATEPVGPAQTTMDAMHGDDSLTAPKQPASGDRADDMHGHSHVQMVSAMVNPPPVEIPTRTQSFVTSERLV